MYRRKEQRITSSLKVAGFTLIEVMVSVFVLSVGILGVAGMQALSVKEAQNTYYRTQADMLVHDVLDRMRANRDAAQDLSASSYAYDSSGGATAKPACDTKTASCDFSQMASYDLAQWWESVQASRLPNPLVRITRTNAADSLYTVQLFWDEDRDGSVATNCNGTQACVQAIVQI